MNGIFGTLGQRKPHSLVIRESAEIAEPGYCAFRAKLSVAILPLPVPTCIQYPRYTPHLQYKCHKPLHTSTTSFFPLPATQIAQRARRKRDREWRSRAQPQGDGAPSHSLSPSLPRSHRTVVPPLRLSNNTALHGPGYFPVFDSRPREPWRTNDVPLKYLAQPDNRAREAETSA